MKICGLAPSSPSSPTLLDSFRTPSLHPFHIFILSPFISDKTKKNNQGRLIFSQKMRGRVYFSRWQFFSFYSITAPYVPGVISCDAPEFETYAKYNSSDGKNWINTFVHQLSTHFSYFFAFWPLYVCTRSTYSYMSISIKGEQKVTFEKDKQPNLLSLD